MSVFVSPYNPVQQMGCLAKNPPTVVVASRAPSNTANTGDWSYLPGTIWVDVGTAVYMFLGLSGVKTGDWLLLANALSGGIVTINGISPDGSGNFGILGTSGQITVTGGVNKDTLSIPHTFSIGSDASTDSGTISVGSGGFLLQGSTGAAMVIGTGLTTGTVLIGGTAQQGSITLGSSSTTNTVKIANGSGAGTVSIAAVQNAGAVNIGTGMTSGTVSIGGASQIGILTFGLATTAQTINIQSAASIAGAQIVNLMNGATPGANSTLNIMCGAGTAGTQTFNLLATGATRAGAINIGTGAAAHVIGIGSSSAGAITITASAAHGLTMVGNAATVGLFNDAHANVVTLGSASGAASLALQGGSAAISYNTSFFSTLGAINTTSTDGFIYSASCAGTPTGTPTSRGSGGGDVPFIFDTSTGTGKLWAYIGGSWVGVALS